MKSYHNTVHELEQTALQFEAKAQNQEEIIYSYSLDGTQVNPPAMRGKSKQNVTVLSCRFESCHGN